MRKRLNDINDQLKGLQQKRRDLDKPKAKKKVLLDEKEEKVEEVPKLNIKEKKARGPDQLLDQSGAMFNRLLRGGKGDKEGRDLDFMRKCLYM